MIFRVASHTDNVGVGSIYVAVPGKKCDGTSFVKQAIDQGAITIVVQEDSQFVEELQQLCNDKSVCFKVVKDARVALAELSAEAYGFPAQKLKLLGVTGTDGKTTSVYILFNLLRAAGKSVAMLSGVEHVLGEVVSSASLTTPKPDYIHHFLHQCVQSNIEYVVMELSAQATSYHRIEGLQFDGLIFTNLSQEHGEQYNSLDDYFEAKCAILAQKKDKAPLIAHDSPWAHEVRKRFSSVLMVGIGSGFDFQINQLQETLELQRFEVGLHGAWYQLETSLIGLYNLFNVVGALSLVSSVGIDLSLYIDAVKNFNGAPGRLERYRLPNGALAVIDYAHTPQAYANILPLLKKHARELIVVFGAGGGKDIQKRSKMGEIAAAYADQIILTNDNPRRDDPQKIMDDIVRGLTPRQKAKVLREPDRARAIMQAYEWSRTGDVIAVLGKGHEITQTVGNNCLYHKDGDIILSI